jgi:hypothetical protein
MHEERRRIGRRRARIAESLLDMAIQLGPNAEPSEARWKVHPSQARVVSGTTELGVRRRGRIEPSK